MSRIFKVQINLDDMAADLIRFRTDEGRSEWLAGFILGAHGHPAAPGDSPATQAGAAFGLISHASAVAFCASQAERGRASAASRKLRFGTANPRTTAEPRLNHGSTTAEPPYERGCELSSIQYPVSSIQKRTSTNPKLSVDAAEDVFSDSPAVLNVIKPNNYMDWKNKYRKHLGMKPECGASDADWSAVFNRNGFDDMCLAADVLIKQLKPGHKLWPNQFSALEDD